MSAICALIVRMSLLYLSFFGRLRELIVVCGMLLAIACMLLIACCSVVLVFIIDVILFLKMMAPAIDCGTHPFVVVVVACFFAVVMSVLSSSIYAMIGWWSDSRSGLLPVSFITYALHFLCCGVSMKSMWDWLPFSLLVTRLPIPFCAYVWGTLSLVVR